jgi:hypothetical protein
MAFNPQNTASQKGTARSKAQENIEERPSTSRCNELWQNPVWCQLHIGNLPVCNFPGTMFADYRPHNGPWAIDPILTFAFLLGRPLLRMLELRDPRQL